MLTSIDHFSKSAHFVTLPKLPSAADILVNRVFLLHGIPHDN